MGEFSKSISLSFLLAALSFFLLTCAVFQIAQEQKDSSKTIRHLLTTDSVLNKRMLEDAENDGHGMPYVHSVGSKISSNINPDYLDLVGRRMMVGLDDEDERRLEAGLVPAAFVDAARAHFGYEVLADGGSLSVVLEYNGIEYTELLGTHGVVTRIVLDDNSIRYTGLYPATLSEPRIDLHCPPVDETESEPCLVYAHGDVSELLHSADNTQRRLSLATMPPGRKYLTDYDGLCSDHMECLNSCLLAADGEKRCSDSCNAKDAECLNEDFPECKHWDWDWYCTPKPCFSPVATTIVEGKGQVSMQDLKIGDNVLSGDGSFKPFFMMSHYHPSDSTDFLQIQTDPPMEMPLEITSNHMMFLHAEKYPVPAGKIKIGDLVATVDGPKSVTSITLVIRNGFYAPTTTGGTIVVDGFVASVNAVVNGKEYIEILGFPLVHHHTAATFAASIAFMTCSIVPMLCNPYLLDDGGRYISPLGKFSQNLLNFWLPLQIIFFLAILLAGISHYNVAFSKTKTA